MSDVSLTSLMSRDFVLVSVNSTVDEARAAAPLGHVAVVMQGALPVGVLTEDRLLDLEEAQQPLSHYAGRFLTPTLTPPDTPLADILQGLSFGPSVRWHVVVQEDKVLGVIAPDVLFGVLSEWVQRPPAQMPEPLRTLIDQLSATSLSSMLKLPGDPLQPKPTLCCLCPGSNPPHRPEWYEIDYTDRLSPTCTAHPGTRVVWQTKPCP